MSQLGWIKNIDIKDPVGTNDKMEQFYEYMQIHNELNAQNPANIDVYEIGKIMDNMDNNDVYALINGANSKVIYTSLSYISLLVIGVRNKSLGKLWSIIRL